MAFGTESTKTIKDATWLDHESVEIRKWNTRQRDELNAEIIKVAGVAGEVTEVTIKAAQIPVVIAGVKSWTFTKDDTPEGDRVPVNSHWVGLLDPDYADFIVSEIWGLNRGRTAEEQESFRDSD